MAPQSEEKKRRLPRACDMCKRKKIRCDSDQMPGKRCSNCVAFNLQCTHVEAMNSLGSAKGYVQTLEGRLDKMEDLFKRKAPGVDLDAQLKEETEEGSSALQVRRGDQDQDIARLSEGVSRMLSIHPDKSFFGMSWCVTFSIIAVPRLIILLHSGLHLLPSIIQRRQQYFGRETITSNELPIRRREQFWNRQSKYPMRVNDTVPVYVFPDPDLMLALVTLYFTHYNSYLPLLHRPTFEKAMADGEHWTDHLYAGTLLLVCALGARHSNDPRIFSAQPGGSEAGWRFFEQLTSFQTALQDRTSATLYELQIHCLSVLYLEAVGLWETVSTQIGLAIRMAQQVGAHVHKNRPPNAHDEAWKRVFWVLIFLDVSHACHYGRPVALRYEDFDIGFPLECDDIYWNHPDPARRFRQPAGRPSALSAFVCLLKLVNTITYVKRSIYHTRNPMILMGGQRRPPETEILSSLDSFLNQWLQSVPEHLRWNPNNQDGLFFNQSVFLHITYHYTRILVHRPYLPAPQSIATCRDAALATLNIVEAQRRRGYLQLMHLVSCVNSTVLTMLLILWNGAEDPYKTREMQYIATCMNMLKGVENRLPMAGAFWDVIADLVSPDAAQSSSRRSRQGSRDSAGSSHSQPAYLYPNVRVSSDQQGSRASHQAYASQSTE
ncbi:fungal-specific transcription factor domain-containing protein [Desarmillaria tabescens]|uniref:Fungal-specific transcription factor domain-containing protein n=1 Tax=Armillaria tabescens TaxID=1929756 RepID=A0AA39N6V1_ARMTA|nr:fungal-specific transcription factor domain-containing protein [Desarmillaria tabescens]KAK0460067.1 fungal-specific transcription factor domain-containing protein [Desarmillaria tabescens]